MVGLQGTTVAGKKPQNITATGERGQQSQLFSVPAHLPAKHMNYQMPKKPQFHPLQQAQASYAHMNNGYTETSSQKTQYQQRPQSNLHSSYMQQHTSPTYFKADKQSQLSQSQLHMKTSLAVDQSRVKGIKLSTSHIQERPHLQQSITSKMMMIQQQHQQLKGPDTAIKKKHAATVTKQYELTIRVIEANLFVNKAMVFQMAVHVKLKMGNEEKKTSVQKGQNPKWDETFLFSNIQRKSQVEFSVYHKTLLSGEELIGNAIFIFEDLYTYNLKKFITLYEKGEAVGGLNINLNVKSKLGSTAVRLQKEDKIQSPLGNIEVGNDDDIDDEVENSIDFRDHEISRQIAPTKSTRNKNFNSGINHTTDEILNRTRKLGIQDKSYQLHKKQSKHVVNLGDVQQQHIVNQRQTESSIIHHYTNQSSHPSYDEDYQQPGGHESGDEQLLTQQADSEAIRKESLHYYKNDPNLRGAEPKSHIQNSNNRSNHQIYIKPSSGVSRNQALIQSRTHQVRDFEENDQVLVPQQLFYGNPQQVKSQMSHSNSTSNILHHQRNPHHYLENSGKTQEVRRHHYTNQNNMIVSNSDDEQEQLMAIPAETDEGEQTIQDNEEALLNMINANYQQQQMIHDQRMAYDTNIMNENQMIAQQHYQHLQRLQRDQIALNMSGYNGVSHPSQQYLNQSQITQQIQQHHMNQFPQQYAKHGPQFFNDRRNSMDYYHGGHRFEIEDGVMMTEQHTHSPLIITPNSHNMPQMMIEQQELDQFQNNLFEENDRIREQEQQLKIAFDQYQHDLTKLHRQKADLQKIKDHLRDESTKIIDQKQELEYQRQQIERAYVNLKREKGIIQESTMLLDETHKGYQECIQEVKQLRGMDGRKIDEILNATLNIQQSLNQLINLQQISLTSHFQQESTSSCGTNSNNGITNFNFLGSSSGPQVQLSTNHQLHTKSPAMQTPLQNQDLYVSQHMKKPQQLHEISPLGLEQTRKLITSQQQSTNHNFQQSPPKVITDIINTEEDEMILAGDAQIDGATELFNKKTHISPRPYKPRSSNFEPMDEFEGDGEVEIANGRKNQIQTKLKNHMMAAGNSNHRGNNQNSDHHELSTIMEREQLTTSQRRSSNDINDNAVTALKMGGQSFFPPGFTQANQLSSDVMNEENYTNTMFVTNPPVPKQHPLTTTNQSQPIQNRIAIPTTPTTENRVQELVSKERQHLDEQKKNFGVILTQLNGLYQNLSTVMKGLNVIPNDDMVSAVAIAQNQLMSPQMNVGNAPQAVTTSPFNATNHVSYEDSQIIDNQRAFLGRDDVLEESKEEDCNSSVRKVNPRTNEIVHITASDRKSNQSVVREGQKVSLDFVYDPDFLKKINQNMLQNDRIFNKVGQVIQPAQAQPVVQNEQEYEGDQPYEIQKEQDLAEDGLIYENQDEQELIIQEQQIQYFQRPEGFDSYGNDDENQLVMSPSDMQLMFDNQVNLDGAISSLGNHLLINQDGFIDQPIQNTSTQGQGDRKIEYIHDDYLQYPNIEEEIKEDETWVNQENDGGNMYGTIKRDEGGRSSRLQEQEQVSQIVDDQTPIELMIKGKKEKLTDEEIQKLIDENYYQNDEPSNGSAKDHSVIMYHGKVFDEKKKAIYGIQKSKTDL